MLTKNLSHIPTSTAHQSRLQIFQPTRRPEKLTRKIVTPWGTATISGKIGQVHADIVEALCHYALDFRTIEETRQLQVLVDPYQIRKSVGGGKPYSGDTLWKMFRELREASIELNAPAQSIRIVGGIIDLAEKSPLLTLSRNGKERPLWRITFNAAFALLLANDLHLRYDPASLAKIETGVSQAIARHVLTHRHTPTGGWHLDNLIRVVGAGGDSATMRNRRRSVKKDMAALANVGVLVKNQRVLLHKCT